MANVLTKAANANTVVATGWTSPTNAYGTATDGAFATAAPAKNGSVSSDFGFPAFTTGEIPDHSTLTSVVANVDWKLSAAVTGGVLGIQSRRNSTGTTLGTETTKTTTTEAVSTQTATGATLTDLRTANELRARVRCAKGNTTSALTGSVDYVSLTATWTEDVSAAAGTITGSASMTAAAAKAVSAAAGSISASATMSATGVAVSPKNVSAAAGTIGTTPTLTAAGRKALSLAAGTIAAPSATMTCVVKKAGRSNAATLSNVATISGGAGWKAASGAGTASASATLTASGIAESQTPPDQPDPPASPSGNVVVRRGCCVSTRIVSR